MTRTSIPLIDLIVVHRELEEDLVGALRSALHSAEFAGGSQVEEFEHEFAAFCGTTYCVGVASGTDALRLALMAAGVGAGDAVVTVAHTFVATVEAISQARAETEFVDVDEDTCLMSAPALDEYLGMCATDPITGRPLGQRTGRPIKAVLPVHLYGQMVDMDAVNAIALRYGLLVVEDACQAHGAEYLSRRTAHGPAEGVWRRAGALGTAAAFSFYPTKNLGACGEAGAVTTNDPRIAQTVRMLRDHGQRAKYHHQLEGYNGRLDALQAAFLRIKLTKLTDWNDARRSLAARYRQLLKDVVQVPTEPAGTRPVYHLYVIRTRDRDGLARQLSADGIQTGLHYPVPLHLQNCYRKWGYPVNSLAVTERVASEVLSLPMFPGLTADDQSRIAEAIAAFIESRRPETATARCGVGEAS